MPSEVQRQIAAFVLGPLHTVQAERRLARQQQRQIDELQAELHETRRQFHDMRQAALDLARHRDWRARHMLALVHALDDAGIPRPPPPLIGDVDDAEPTLRMMLRTPQPDRTYVLVHSNTPDRVPPHVLEIPGGTRYTTHDLDLAAAGVWPELSERPHMWEYAGADHQWRVAAPRNPHDLSNMLGEQRVTVTLTGRYGMGPTEYLLLHPGYDASRILQWMASRHGNTGRIHLERSGHDDNVWYVRPLVPGGSPSQDSLPSFNSSPSPVPPASPRDQSNGSELAHAMVRHPPLPA